MWKLQKNVTLPSKKYRPRKTTQRRDNIKLVLVFGGIIGAVIGIPLYFGIIEFLNSDMRMDDAPIFRGIVWVIGFGSMMSLTRFLFRNTKYKFP